MRFSRPFVARAGTVVAVATALAALPAARAAALQVATGPIALESGGCLTAGSTVDVEQCNGWGTQTWTLTTDGSLHNNGMCLDVADGSIQAGAGLVVDACRTGANSQRWYWNSTASGELVNLNSEGC